MTRLRAGRVRILWLVLGALLLVSALPIGLYHRQVLALSQEKLVDTERVQQTELTRSLAQEVQFFESNLTQQLISERQILTLTGLIDNVEDPVAEPKVTSLLENFVDSNRNTFIYLTAVGRSGKGTSASQGNFRAEQDPFVAKALQRAFVSCVQSVKFRSDPLALAPDNRPAFVIAVPLKDSNDNFTGMLAAVVSLDTILRRLQDASVRGRSVFVVDHYGHIVAHPQTKTFVPGEDLSEKSHLVAQIKALPKELRNTETVRFTEKENNHSVEMVGTYSTFPEVNWAVIAQRSLESGARRCRRHRTKPAGSDIRGRSSFCSPSCSATSLPLASADPFAVWPLPHAPSAAVNSISARRSKAPPKSANSPRTSTSWPATSRSTSSA